PLLPLMAALILGSDAASDQTPPAPVATDWSNGTNAIRYAHPLNLKDHFTMSGRAVNLILEWEVDAAGVFQVQHRLQFPMLRTIPDQTHSAWEICANGNEVPAAICDGKPLDPGQVTELGIYGVFEAISRHREGTLSLRRVIFPALNQAAELEVVAIENNDTTPHLITVPTYAADISGDGVFGHYLVEIRQPGTGPTRLVPGETLTYTISRAGRRADDPPYYGDGEAELAARLAMTQEIFRDLVLETPDPVINTMFAFAKFHTTESIFATRGGLMHAPGGYARYLAAIWANDEAEYTNPLCPFIGNPAGNLAAMNSFRMFAAYCNPEYRPIPSSIIAEGRATWHGAGDRGDMAMIAHGAARFALASGREDWGRELLPLVRWSLEYCRRHLTPDGVVASDADELERRLPAGKANLCTSSLYYDALLRGADLCDALGETAAVGRAYRRAAGELRRAINHYFAAEVEGFATYRYYDGNTVLRSWIGIPLVFGIDERAQGTVDALLSDRLWFGDGLLSASGTNVYWDRSALYAFRGMFFCRYADRAYPYLANYSRSRLLGKHVPYPVEAYPEGHGSQLAAESALYCRIFTEGMFGIVPRSFTSFTVKPALPTTWNEAKLRRIKAFGRTFDLTVHRTPDGYRITVTDTAGKVLQEATGPDGKEIMIAFH
ncbi:MAG: hypothetical protein PHQ27_09600, partial [Victivallales bacterium]|nr:hypothetical protein [Victivallales bacterium]